MGYNWPPEQMKKPLLLAVAMFVATFSFAQQQLATLNHNDSISVFYGIDALIQAHNAAENGDIITLSSGIFNGLEITKSVTIRGAGMFSNDSLDIERTIIRCYDGSRYITKINIMDDSNHYLLIEGVFFNNTVLYTYANNPQFLKCRFQTLEKQNNDSRLNNATFVNCILNSYSRGNIKPNNTFINSVILGLGDGPFTLMNCIAHCNNYSPYLSLLYIHNSILFYTITTSGEQNYNGANCYYSIGVSTDSIYSSYFNAYRYYEYFSTATTPDHHLYNVNSLRRVFKYFNGTYTDGMSFELQDNIANTILGSDSTQVGIYGGMFPFDPYVRNPLIKKCNVAQRSTADGKLAVDIEVISGTTIEQETETEDE